MNLNNKEIEALIQASGMIAEQSEDEKYSLFMQNICDKLKVIKAFGLTVKLSPERKKRIRVLLDQASSTSLEYSQYAGDMSMINEYDRIKKEAAAITDAMGDVEGQLRADQEHAKKLLEACFDRVKQDLIDEEMAKSSAEAERKARVDDRYLCALEDYNELSKWTYTVRNKFSTLCKTREDAKQSVSTARNSIIAEGYNS